MDYHKDRFQDCSLLVFKKEELVAVLPAHESNHEVYSHKGLTYGGLLTKSSTTSDIELCFNAILAFLKDENFTAVTLKLIPQFLQGNYSSAIEYFLFQKNATLIHRDLNLVIDLRNDIDLHRSKRRLVKVLEASPLKVVKSDSFKEFWEGILIPVLQEKFDATPVHSLAEITMLHEKFPENIVQYNLEEDGVVVAGITLFIANGVVKSQYSAAHNRGKELRALELLYVALFETFKKEGYRYFDLGTTTLSGTKDYNTGLTRYKEEFGASPMNLDVYRLTL
ncbi:MAG: GNAT family N-acetyltransferase [Bacteroidetes bacterium]|nr:GNAT family N-acetyltransferase [Bacteroidota bacterium]